jgi:hypothetical protein
MKIYKSANNSTTTEARENLSADEESLKMKENI